MKYLDQPADTKIVPYEMFMEQVNAGRAVVVIPVRHSQGLKGTYIYSARITPPVTEHGGKVACIRMAHRAVHAAECEEYDPIAAR